MLELDLMLGKFAESKIFCLENKDLYAYECLLEEEETAILAWLTGVPGCPVEYQGIVNLIMSCADPSGGSQE